MARLKAVVGSLDEIQEDLRSLYREENGKFLLDADGVEDVTGLKTALERERQARGKYEKEAREARKLAERFGDLGTDPDEIKATLEKAKQNDEDRLKAAGRNDEVLAKKLESVQKDFDARLKKYEEKIKEADERESKARAKLRLTLIDNAIRDAAAKAGILPTAVDDVLLRGRAAFQLEDDERVVARDADGTILLQVSGEVETVESWLKGRMAKAAPHWWGPSAGSGAVRSASGGAFKPRSQMTNKEKAEVISRLSSELGSEASVEAYNKLPY